MNIFTILLIQPLTSGLILFYKILGGNLGLAIIGFSLFLRVILNPLTKPYMESMKKMKEFTPQLEKLKLKYKNDKQGLLKAQADFYKEKGINPGAGCLPYAIQIIILIALFNVFISALSVNTNGVAKLNGLLYPPLRFANEQKLNTRFLYLDVTKPDSFGLPGVPFKIPGLILILSALAQFVSAKMLAPLISAEESVAKKTKDEKDDIQVAMQQSMIYTFPLFTLVFGLNFPSGLALYWLLFSLFQIWQQYTTSGWGGLTPWLKKFGLIKS